MIRGRAAGPRARWREWPKVRPAEVMRGSSLALEVLVTPRAPASCRERGYSMPVCSPETAWSLYGVAKDFAAPLIAVIVGCIALAQWRLAHRKLVLDLFKARYEVFEQIRAALAPVVTSGAADRERSIAFGEAVEKAKFLFRPKVTSKLEDIAKLLADLERPAIDLESVNRASQVFQTVRKFHGQLPELFRGYLTFHQRIVFW